MKFKSNRIGNFEYSLTNDEFKNFKLYSFTLSKPIERLFINYLYNIGIDELLNKHNVLSNEGDYIECLISGKFIGDITIDRRSEYNIEIIKKLFESYSKELYNIEKKLWNDKVPIKKDVMIRIGKYTSRKNKQLYPDYKKTSSWLIDNIQMGWVKIDIKD